jgi:hypothetical protein
MNLCVGQSKSTETDCDIKNGKRYIYEIRESLEVGQFSCI